MGDDFLVQKLPHAFFMCLTIIMFCAGFTLFFPLCFPFKLWWFLCYGLFLQLHFMLIFTSLLRLILSFIFPWYFPEKSGTFCLFFVTFQWILFCSVELFLLVILLSRWFIRLFIRILFVYLFVYFLTGFLFVILFLFFKLFSCPYLFISYSLFFVKLC